MRRQPRGVSSPPIHSCRPTEHRLRPQQVSELPVLGPAWHLSRSFVNSAVYRDDVCLGFCPPDLGLWAIEHWSSDLVNLELVSRLF